jgi:hypothetical protein
MVDGRCNLCTKINPQDNTYDVTRIKQSRYSQHRVWQRRLNEAFLYLSFTLNIKFSPH